MGGKTSSGTKANSRNTGANRQAVLPARRFREEADTKEVQEYGVTFKTGQPVTFNFIRNTEKSPRLPGDEFQQSLEPAGRYMLHDFDPKAPPPPNWEKGTASFQKPLVIDMNSNPDAERAYDDTSWKSQLSQRYQGKTGAQLTKALRDDGFDGIVTVESGGKAPETREIVDLNIKLRPSSIEELRVLSDKELEATIQDASTSIAEAAQKIVDEWDPDDEEGDLVYGHGGACDDVAKEIGEILGNLGFEIVDGGQDGDDHAYVIAHDGKRAFAVDIPPGVYERGGGYNWKKIPGAKITANDVTISPVPIQYVVEDLEDEETGEVPQIGARRAREEAESENDAEPSHVREASGLRFQLDSAQESAGSEFFEPVLVDVDKVEESWRKDNQHHIGLGGKNAIHSRYQDFQQWLKDNPDVPIIMPNLDWSEYKNHVTFSNGRHRFSVLRDMGIKKIWVSVGKEQKGIIEKQVGAKTVQENAKNRNEPFTPNTEGATVKYNIATQDDFQISAPDGSKITGYAQNADFPGDTSSATRGEIFWAEAKTPGKGMGTQLIKDAIALLKSRGIKTVNMSAVSESGRALVQKAINLGLISPAIRQAKTGKTEHEIIAETPAQIKNFMSTDDAPQLQPVGHAHDIRSPEPQKPPAEPSKKTRKPKSQKKTE